MRRSPGNTLVNGVAGPGCDPTLIILPLDGPDGRTPTGSSSFMP
jgi:hypothetical protein